MNKGFVRLGRGFFDHYLWAEERVFSRAEAWLDFVAQSAYEPHKRLVAGRLVEVPRGGLVASERFLSERWKWSRTKVQAFLELLKSDGMISLKKDQETTVVILCNYETYNARGAGKKPPKNPPPTAREPAGNQREEEGEGQNGKDAKPEANASASGPFARPSRAVFDEHVTGVLKRTPRDADHVWNVWEENDWTRAQAGQRVPIQFWRRALSTWETGGLFPSQKSGGRPVRPRPGQAHGADAVQRVDPRKGIPLADFRRWLAATYPKVDPQSTPQEHTLEIIQQYLQTTTPQDQDHP